MKDKEATVRFLQFIKLNKAKPEAGLDVFDFWKSPQSYTHQTLKHKMQNPCVMDELPYTFGTCETTLEWKLISLTFHGVGT